MDINWVNNTVDGETEPIVVQLDGEGEVSAVSFEEAFGGFDGEDFYEARGRRRRRRHRRRRLFRKLVKKFMKYFPPAVAVRMAKRAFRKRRKKAGSAVVAKAAQETLSAAPTATDNYGQAGPIASSDQAQTQDQPSTASEEPTAETPSPAETGVAQEPSTASDEQPSEGVAENATDESSEDESAPKKKKTFREAEQDEGDTSAEEQSVDEEKGESDEAAEFTGSSGADGKPSRSTIDEFYDNFYASENGQARIPEKVLGLAHRIEKNKQLIAMMTASANELNAKAAVSELSHDQKVALREANRKAEDAKQRLTILEKEMAALSGASSMSGDDIRSIARRNAMLRRAKWLARDARKQFIRGMRSTRREKRRALVSQIFQQLTAQGVQPQQAIQQAHAQARQQIPFLTNVQSTLGAQISPQRIEIPPQSSSADGTGLIGVDNAYDFDAPPVRTVELDFSNADGLKKINWGHVALGVGATALAIYLYKRFMK